MIDWWQEIGRTLDQEIFQSLCTHQWDVYNNRYARVKHKYPKTQCELCGKTMDNKFYIKIK